MAIHGRRGQGSVQRLQPLRLLRQLPAADGVCAAGRYCPPATDVRQALYFSARLRTDLTDKEIDARTEKVLHDLGIPDKIDTVIGSPERKTLPEASATRQHRTGTGLRYAGAVSG